MIRQHITAQFQIAKQVWNLRQRLRSLLRTSCPSAGKTAALAWCQLSPRETAALMQCHSSLWVTASRVTQLWQRLLLSLLHLPARQSGSPSLPAPPLPQMLGLPQPRAQHLARQPGSLRPRVRKHLETLAKGLPQVSMLKCACGLSLLCKRAVSCVHAGHGPAMPHTSAAVMTGDSRATLPALHAMHHLMTSGRPSPAQSCTGTCKRRQEERHLVNMLAISACVGASKAGTRCFLSPSHMHAGASKAGRVPQAAEQEELAALDRELAVIAAIKQEDSAFEAPKVGTAVVKFAWLAWSGHTALVCICS